MAENFNTGDHVYVISGTWRDYIRKATISRVTKTQAIIEGTRTESRYNRETGREVGTSGYNASRIELPTPSLDSQWRENRGKRLASNLSLAARNVERGNEESKEVLLAAINAWIAHEGGSSD